MAIVSMKRVRLLGMAGEKDALLHTMQRFGCVQVSELEGDTQAYRPQDSQALTTAADRLNRVRWTIGQLNRYDTTKSGFLSSFSMPTVEEAQAEEAAQSADALMAVVEAVEEIERRSGELRGQETRLRAQIELLLPWRPLRVPVEKIRNTRDTVQFLGTIQNRSLAPLVEVAAEWPVTIEHLGDERDSAFIWVIAHRDVKDALQAALKDADFTAFSFANEQGTIAQLLDSLHAEAAAAQKKRDDLEEELKTLASHVPALKLFYEISAEQVGREEAAERFAVTGSTFLMEGWVPAYASERLEKKLRAIASDIAIDFRDPLDDEKPPTMLQNPRAFAPFETIVTSYSYPDPRGIDPTVVMAPFFACLFGIMLSDAGYGLLLAIGIPLIQHFLKPKPGTRKLLWVLFWGGLFTVFWGAMFDTWFGASIRPMLINMLEQPLEMMGLCLGVGALHLFTGLGVAAYMNIRRGKVLDAVFDQLLWVTLIVGIVMLVLPATAAVGKWMAILSVVGILLTAGRAKPSIVGKLIGGAGSLYNISSWLSDLLSYMRLFGMGLATGVIGMVFNMLAGLLMAGGVFGYAIAIVVLVVGHVFNFAINALGAYVHSCRLQYIEFFSKFYEDGGDPFTPLAQKPLYVAIRPSDAGSVES